MGTRSSDFNYKVALASGLKSLQAGRLRQAEEQFRYLVKHFPGEDGGYRGLAKVLVEQEDRPAALRMLLDGGAAVAKAGERAGATALYRDAVALDGRDLTAHRRLAAALALAGEHDAAADEYVRYIQSAIASGANERARIEAEFAVERLPYAGDIVRIARSLGVDVNARPASSSPMTEVTPPSEPLTVEARAELLRAAWGPPVQASAATEAAVDSLPVETQPPTEEAVTVEPAAAPAASVTDPWSEVIVPPADPHAITVDTNGAATPSASEEETVEATAARYLAKNDPRGAEAALDVARRYIADGRTNAASDLLLQLISSGVADHDAQRLLVEVVRSLGKRDVAKAKCQLLVQALRLDGRDDLAAEVEQLAQRD